MDIAIIGAGNVGKALAGSFKRAGHQVTITATHPEHAADAAQATGSRAAASNAEAIAGSDFVVLAVPETALEALSAARTLEGMAWLNISRNLAGGTWQDAWILVGPDTAANHSNN